MQTKDLQPKKALRAALFFLLLSVVGMTKANPVDLQTAREVAVKFVNANTKVALRGTDDLQLVTTYRTESDDAAFHIFNTPNGFVIVSADDCATPILGYSDEGRPFDPNNVAIQLQDILQGYVEQIQNGIENHLEADEHTALQWSLVRTTGRLTNNRSDEVVEPLLTTKWNQDYPYDMFVPSGCPTGCVATAMAQIMKYWEWPVQGTGEHSYQWNGQILSANFGETIYDWDNMLNDYDYYNNYSNNQPTQEQEEAVATLMWHCGVSVNMNYSPSGSGASLYPSSLINYFSYSDEMSYEYRYNYSDASWKAKLKDCLGLGRPVCCGGASDVDGHEFVCDGYDSNELFHFNLGWGGSSDGYYAIDGPIGGYINTVAIFNIHPQGETTTYVINVSANSVEGGSVTGGGTFAHGENVTLSATANDGYGFCYWEENGGIASTNPNYSFTANYNRDLVAVFAEPFTVTVSASEGGTAVGGGSYFYGETCAVTATPNEGYNFANWTANDFVVSVDANYTYNVTGNTILTAHFVPDGNIEFADANVKAICVTHWDTNGDGELSYAEAAAVTSLGEVFRGNTEITSFEELQYFVSLTSINKYAFYGCSGLTGSLIIPDRVTSIGLFAFDGCSGLTGSLIIPNRVTSIGNYAFRGCSGLIGNLIIPNSVTSIGSSAFYRCSGLNAVYYAGDIHQWCNIHFGNHTSNPLRYAHNLYIDNELVTELVIPETVTKIRDYVFYGATCLTSLTIPNTVTSIGNSAFDGCSGLTGSLIIPNTVTSIGYSAFSGCSGFTGSLTISNTVTSIGGSAFYNCSGFTGELVIPNSVTSIGEYAFGNCTGLTSLVLGNSVTTIDIYSFYGCSGLTGNLIIPNSVTSIEYAVFWGCSGLTSIEIPNSVTSIGGDAFYDCSGLHAVYYAGDIHQWCNIQFADYGANPLRYAHNLYINNELVTELVIPETVTEIKDYAFNGATCLTSLAIPNIVTSIGSSAFYNCSGITGSLTIPNTVTSLGGSAFYNCSGFAGELVIPNTVTSIGSSAFYNCSGFTGDLTIPNSVTSIGGWAFSGCNGFTGSLTIPNSVTSIGNSAFSNCSGFTGSLTIPNSVTSIGSYAFSGCRGLTGSLTIPNSVTSIGGSAFYNCYGLSSMVVLAETPPTVGSNAFYNVPINIPVYVPCESLETYQTAEGWNAFLNIKCISSGTISVVADPNEGGEVSGGGMYEGGVFCTVIATPNEGYRFANWTENGHIVSSDTNYSFVVTGESVLTAHFVPDGNIVFADANVKAICVNHWDADGDGELSYVEAASVTTIGFVFNGNTEITSFEELQYFINLSTIGNYAFYNCSSLTGELIIPNSVTEIGEFAFYDCSGFTGNLTIPNSVTSIGDYTFYSCSGLTGDLTIPNSVTSIGSYAFRGCSGLTGNLTIPNSVTSIGSCAFISCSGFTGDLIIPNSVTSIGSSAFYGCSGFTGNLIISNSLTSINNETFYHCSGFTGELSIPNSVTSIGEWAFCGCSGFTGNLTIPNTVTSIEGWAFNGCNGFTGNLTIGDSVINIGKMAFNGCSGFTGSLIIPNSVTTIEWNAFSGCSGFTGSLTISNSVTSIGSSAFYNCSGLTGDLVIPNSVTSIGYGAFNGCSGLTGDLTIPNTVTSIESYAFYGCSGFTGNLTIGNSVTSISSYAFSGCSGLTSITIHPETPPTISSTTFFNCPKSIPVYVPCGCVEAYQSAAYWGQFTNIQEVCTQTQSIVLTEGWNWFSTNVEISLDDLENALVEALPGTTINIKSQTQNVKYQNGRWAGTLTALDMTQMYMISVTNDCEITLEGTPIDPSTLTVTINNGANWIAFPYNQSMTVTNFFGSFPVNNDQVKSQSQNARYQNNRWAGQLNTLVPGKGYMYISNTPGTRTFTFPASAK